MRKLVFTLLMLLTLALNAQNKGVVKFIGIPVDGSRNEMISQLKKQGFIYNNETDWLEGMLNGEQVYIYVHTNSFEVVDRIVVQPATLFSESNIKIKFNDLVKQFENDTCYSNFLGDQYIGENEDISYEMTENNKQFEAIFHQRISKEEIDEIKPYIIDNYDSIIADTLQLLIMKEEEDVEIGDNKNDNINALLSMYANQYENNNNVWFLIMNLSYDQYYILIMYDNLYKLELMEDD